MATLGVTFTGAALSMSGGKKTDDPTTPPINAKSSDEENFVKCVFFPFYILAPSARSYWLALSTLSGLFPNKRLTHYLNREYVKKAADKVQGKQ